MTTRDPVPTSVVAKRLGVSVPTIHRWSEEQGGPKPVMELARQKLWDFEEVRAFAINRYKKQAAQISAKPAAEEKPSRSDHGTRARYRAGCRCDACRGAQAAYMRELRAKRRSA